MTPDQDAQTTAHMLFRSAEALMTCAEGVARIEVMIGPMIDRYFADVDTTALQEIDLLGQTLVDISTCLSRLALARIRQEPIDQHEILAPLRLNDLRNRLIGIDAAPNRDVALF